MLVAKFVLLLVFVLNVLIILLQFKAYAKEIVVQIVFNAKVTLVLNALKVTTYSVQSAGRPVHLVLHKVVIHVYVQQALFYTLDHVFLHALMDLLKLETNVGHVVILARLAAWQ